MVLADLRETVQRLAHALRGSGLPFHFTGGIVSSHYGEPRFTADIDVVLILPADRGAIRSLVERLQSAFIIDEESVQASLESMSMFQGIDAANFLKVDFHVGERIPGGADRAIETELYAGVRVPVTCVEDCILSKLLWYSMGSDRAWSDLLSIMRRQHPIRSALIHDVAEQLGLSTELDRLLRESEQDRRV